MSCGAETTRDYAHIAASYILTALITVHGVREHEQAEWDENEKKAEGCARAVPTRVSSQHLELTASHTRKKQSVTHDTPKNMDSARHAYLARHKPVVAKREGALQWG